MASKNRLLTTVAWKMGQTIEYAQEGSVFIGGGAAVAPATDSSWYDPHRR